MPMDFGVGSAERLERRHGLQISAWRRAARSTEADRGAPSIIEEFAHDGAGSRIAGITLPSAAALTLTFSNPSSIL